MRTLGLRIEDLLLAAWNAAGVPIVALSGLSPIVELGDAPDPVAGTVQLVAVLLALVAVATRPTGSIDVGIPLGTDGRLAFYGPLVGAVTFVSGSAAAYLGLGIDGLIVGTSFLVITGAMVFGNRPARDRRRPATRARGSLHLRLRRHLRWLRGRHPR